MAGIQNVPLRIPAQWSPEWFETFVREVLSKLDTRNSIGVGVAVTSDGNSVATLDTSGGINSAIAAHKAETDPHPDLIDDLTAATAVALADYAIVSQSGANKKATVDQLATAVFGDDWTDLVISGTAINPLGAGSDPSLNTSTGLLEFSASADNLIVFTWQMPHGWSGQFDNTKAVVVPHMHVRHLTSTTTPANVSRWKLEYDVADANGTFTNAYNTWTTLTTVSETNPADTTKCGIVSFGNLDLAGYGGSTILHCRITRLANSDAADTDTSVIALYSADLHYQVRRAGTETAIP